MKIIAVTPQKGHLYRVELSEKTVFIERDYAAEIGLKPGMEIDEAGLKNIVAESEYRRAKSRALWFLDRADRSEKVLCEKIVAGKISKTAALKAIERLKELGLVDDLRYAENLYSRLAEANVSKRAAYAKMYEKGVPPEIIKKVLNENEPDENAQIKALIERKYRLKIEADDGPQKVAAALIRKGFSYSAVRHAVNEYTENKLQEEDY